MKRLKMRRSTMRCLLNVLTALSLVLCMASLPIWLARPHAFATADLTEPALTGRVKLKVAWDKQISYLRVYVPRRRLDVGPPAWVIENYPATVTLGASTSILPNPALDSWEARQQGPQLALWDVELVGEPQFRTSGDYLADAIESIPSSLLAGNSQTRDGAEKFTYLTLIGTWWTLRLPRWFPIAVTALLPAIRLMRAVVRALPRLARPAWVCVACGYDIRATPNRCPECGTVPRWVKKSA